MIKREPAVKTLSPPPPTDAKEAPSQAQAKRSPLIDRLVAWRKKHELTQKETAARLEIGFDTYKSYEIGHRNPNGPSTHKILALLGELKQ